MRFLVVGGGGREHALAWRLSEDGHEVAVAPGNAGTRLMGLAHLDVRAEDVEGLVAQARRLRPDCVVIGPEAPLALGLADALRAAGLAVFGPDRAAARIETSKAWAKAFMARHGIPTAAGRAFTDAQEAERYAASLAGPAVVKAGGLAAGKGVFVCGDAREAAAAVRAVRRLGEAGREIVIEERLEGRECSLIAVTDGRRVLPLAPARDHKRALDGDRGPNTGGMGAYSPLPDVTEAQVDAIRRRILEPAVAGLAAEGCPFRGALYAGLMLTAEGPKVLEFNARFGDPETQVLLPRLRGDFGALLAAAAHGELHRARLAWDPAWAVGVVVAAAGYPEAPRTGMPVAGLEAAAAAGALVFHAGTVLEGGRVLVRGGRVLTIVGLGPDVAAARERAYAACRAVGFEGAWYRNDIAGGTVGGPQA
ncbi:MAG: phosphoribosylamine--glycine ligase [Firmicutes bacterium]|nr:phosphoribosylamine--glycine ligase [Bacillota bacterium]